MIQSPHSLLAAVYFPIGLFCLSLTRAESTQDPLRDVIEISTEVNATSFTYNGTEWHFVEPDCGYSNFDNITYDSGRRFIVYYEYDTADSGNDTSKDFSRLMKRLASPDGPQRREGSEEQEDEPQQQNDGDQQEQQQQQQQDGHAQPPEPQHPWAPFQMEIGEFAFRYLNAKRLDGGSAPSYSYYRAIQGTNIINATPAFIKWLWRGPEIGRLPRDVMIKILWQNFFWKRVHFIISGSLWHHLLRDYIDLRESEERRRMEMWGHRIAVPLLEETWVHLATRKDIIYAALSNEDLNGFDSDRRLAQLRESLIVEGTLVFNREGLNDSPNENTKPETIEKRAKSFASQFDWTRLTMSEAAGVRNLMRDLRVKYDDLAYNLYRDVRMENSEIRTANDLSSLVATAALGDSVLGQSVALRALDLALENDRTVFRQRNSHDIVLREDWRDDIPVKPPPMALKEGSSQSINYDEGDLDDIILEELPSRHKRPGEGTSRDSQTEGSDEPPPKKPRQSRGSAP